MGSHQTRAGSRMINVFAGNYILERHWQIIVIWFPKKIPLQRRVFDTAGFRRTHKMPLIVLDNKKPMTMHVSIMARTIRSTLEIRK